MIEVLIDTLLDSLRLLPFLFITYIIMEYLEHKTSDKAKRMIKKSGGFGPLLGGVLGIVPQCGFSAAASSLYAGRIVTLGTLMAIFLSTSDEMLPILISEAVGLPVILKILAWKAGIAVFAGFIIDLTIRRKGRQSEEMKIDDLCAHEHCHCESGILRSAVKHTLQILFFIMAVSFALNAIMYFVGEDALSGLIFNRPILGVLIAGVVGLIPNCAASVLITQLYLQGAMGFGAMMAGLLVGAGVGLLVLFRVNQNKKENIQITALLYAVGIAAGILLECGGVQI